MRTMLSIILNTEDMCDSMDVLPRRVCELLVRSLSKCFAANYDDDNLELGRSLLWHCYHLCDYDDDTYSCYIIERMSGKQKESTIGSGMLRYYL